MMYNYKDDFFAHKQYPSEPGDPMKDLYIAQVTESGAIDLVKTGTDNLYERIQADKDSCDINKIIERYQAGDMTALERRASAYFDSTEMPKNLAESYAKLFEAERYFNQLPVEVRSKYGFNFGTFLSTVGSGDFSGLVKSVDPESAPVPVEDDAKSKGDVEA